MSLRRTRIRLLQRTFLRYKIEQSGDSASVSTSSAPSFYGSFSYDHLPKATVVDLAVPLIPFQQEGVGWMVRRERSYQGGIMADHLGMGKTVQMIALCLAADSVVENTSELSRPTSTGAHRMSTVLRQLVRLPLVSGCSRINRPAQEVPTLLRQLETIIRGGTPPSLAAPQNEEALRSIRSEVDKWLQFVGKTYPVYKERASSFLDDSVEQVAYNRADSKVLRTLVIVPASLLLQWKSEIENKINPSRRITVYLFHGKGKLITSTELENFDFVITTYDTVAHAASKPLQAYAHSDGVSQPFSRAEAGPLFQIMWKRIILDEAHMVRHAQTLRWKALLQLQAAKRWAVTATPLHNSIDDLQNLLYFVGCARLPVLPGAASVDILEDAALQQSIARSLQATLLRRGPVMMRNGVREVLVELPHKVETVQYGTLSPKECVHYNQILSTSKASIGEQTSTHTAHVFSLMTKLRQSCCHPWLSDGKAVQLHLCGLCKGEAVGCITTKCGHTFCSECLLQKFHEQDDAEQGEGQKIPCPACETPLRFEATFKKRVISSAERITSLSRRDYEPSTKLNLLLTSIQLMRKHSPQDKMIVFSHFTSFLDVITVMLQREGIEFARLDGTMSLASRNAVIRGFQTSPAPVLLASKTATGVGLNLTAANHVIIIDPWWNPAIEEQAVHRCHRIGQTKSVSVTRMVMSDTIEQYCFDISKKKKEFGDAILKAATSGQAGAKAVTSKLEELLARLNFVGTSPKDAATSKSKK